MILYLTNSSVSNVTSILSFPSIRCHHGMILLCTPGSLQVTKVKPGLIIRKQNYAIYADHFAHVGRVFSATNAHLHRSDCADAEYKHSYNIRRLLRCPLLTFWSSDDLATWMLDCHWLIGRDRCVYAGLRGISNKSISLKWYANRYCV